jgi:hypothetical protein
MRLLIEESADNLTRVKSLLHIFKISTDGNIGTEIERAELLRAAVAFMHSSIEEIIRNLFVDRLPNAPSDVLNELSYSIHSSTNRAKGILLGELMQNYRGRFVENIIIDSINSHVDRLNINNSEQLASQLKKVNIDTNLISKFLSDIDSLMKRRHQIVHQMDREDNLDPDIRPTTQIDILQVESWLSSVEGFHAEIIRQVKNT